MSRYMVVPADPHRIPPTSREEVADSASRCASLWPPTPAHAAQSAERVAVERLVPADQPADFRGCRLASGSHDSYHYSTSNAVGFEARFARPNGDHIDRSLFNGNSFDLDISRFDD